MRLTSYGEGLDAQFRQERIEGRRPKRRRGLTNAEVALKETGGRKHCDDRKGHRCVLVVTEYFRLDRGFGAVPAWAVVNGTHCRSAYRLGQGGGLACVAAVALRHGRLRRLYRLAMAQDSSRSQSACQFTECGLRGAREDDKRKNECKDWSGTMIHRYQSSRFAPSYGSA